MIVVKFMQGLGNQMFQYAAARALSIHKNSMLKKDISNYTAHSKRDYELEKYFDINIAAVSEEERNAIDLSHPVRRIWNKVFNNKICALPYEEKAPARLVYSIAYLFRPPHIQHVYEEKQFSFDRNFFKAGDTSLLKGYWMSYKYFEQYSLIIKRDFTVKRCWLKNIQHIVEEVNSSNSIALHIRCTDKKIEPRYLALYGELSKQYYSDAVEHIANTTKQPVKLYIFSDDIQAAKKYIPEGFATRHISSCSTQYAIEDFYLMVQCKHIVMANSTFSWWAGYLNIHNNGIKVIPFPWYANNRYNAKDLYYPGWVVLNHIVS